MKFLLLKTGTTVPNVAERRGDFEAWFARGLGLDEKDLDVVRVYEGEPLPDVDAHEGVVVTGSAAMVTDEAPWSLESERFLAEAVKAHVPVLGVCYGHQLLARALGGEVLQNPRGRQVGTVDVKLTEDGRRDPLLGQLPSTLHVPVSHSQAVSRLPPGARRLASSPRDDNHAFAFGDRTWGVQFHPEFDADIVRGYIDARETALRAEGLDVDALRRNATDTSHGSELLRGFVGAVSQLSPRSRS